MDRYRLRSLLAVAVVAPSILFSRPLAAHPRDAESPMSRLGETAEALADTNDIVDIVSDTTMTLWIEGHPLRVPYFANRLLDDDYTDVTRAVVVICGTLRNADDYYRAMMIAADLAGADRQTLVIAPQFLTEADIVEHDLPSDVLYWSYMGWRQGDHSLDSVDHPRPERISSFAVVDTILLRLARRNPNLGRIVVAGHSAGGQFTNFYATGNRIQQMITSIYHVPIRYIVSNPSCYIYFSPERWIQGTAYDFAVPDPQTIEECPDYNHYKYGLEEPNEYMSIGSEQLIQQYREREVVYLLGMADTNPNDFYLDTSCMAELEGSQRLERGTVYWHFIGHFFGTGIYDLQNLGLVPGVGHDHQGMFVSQCGLYYIFDYGTCPDTPPPSDHWSDAASGFLRTFYAHAVAWGDYDGDRREDLYLTQVDHPSILAHNAGHGSFSDATSPPVDDAAHGMTAAWGDYDNDGLPDLYLAHWRSPNRLFHNGGGGSFTDVTSFPLAIDGDSDGAFWVDYDNDGDLDLYVTRTTNQSNLMLRNDGPVAGFVDASAPPLNYRGSTRCAAWGDYDNDGDQDVYLCIDHVNKLLRNDGGGAFVDVTSGPLENDANCSSACWGDYDNDGDLDLYVVNRSARNRLLRNDGGGQFADATSGPLGLQANGWSAAWGDYDNDGWLDLFVANGGPSNRLYHNEGAGSFADSTAYPLDGPSYTYCGGWADYDGDGDLDLFIVGASAPCRLAKNLDAAAGNHWLEVDLIGTQSNRSAIGARVRVVATGRSQIRQIGGDGGYLAQSSATAEFGLGSALLVDTLEVRWPSGIVQRRTRFDTNQRFTVWEYDGPEDVPPVGPSAFGIDRVVPNPLDRKAEIRCTIPTGPAGLAIYDAAGRLVRTLAVSGGPGSRAALWDGNGEDGRSVAPGVYFCRLWSAGRTSQTRIVVLRR